MFTITLHCLNVYFTAWTSIAISWGQTVVAPSEHSRLIYFAQMCVTRVHGCQRHLAGWGHPLTCAAAPYWVGRRVCVQLSAQQSRSWKICPWSRQQLCHALEVCYGEDLTSAWRALVFHRAPVRRKKRTPIFSLPREKARRRKRESQVKRDHWRATENSKLCEINHESTSEFCLHELHAILGSF